MNTSFLMPGPLALQRGGEEAAYGLFAGCYTIFILVLAAMVIAGWWKMFSKAGQPGWAAIVPIYNLIVYLRLTGRPEWWIVFYLIPFANIVVHLIVSIDAAKSFGQGTGFGVGLFLLAPVFVLILGFGSAQYVGPAAAVPAPPATWQPPRA